jgi:hypothetical protein
MVELRVAEMDDAECGSFAYRHSQNGGGPSDAAGSFNDLRIFRGGDESMFSTWITSRSTPLGLRRWRLIGRSTTSGTDP